MIELLPLVRPTEALYLVGLAAGLAAALGGLRLLLGQLGWWDFRPHTTRAGPDATRDAPIHIGNRKEVPK